MKEVGLPYEKVNISVNLINFNKNIYEVNLKKVEIKFIYSFLIHSRSRMMLLNRQIGLSINSMSFTAKYVLDQILKSYLIQCMCVCL